MARNLRNRLGSRGRPPRAPARNLRKESSIAVYRDGIVAAAERVFERSGFTDVTMSDVAREAGLSVGTLYNYFDSKEQIFRTLLEWRGEQFLSHLEEVRGTTSRDRLAGLVTAVLTYVEQHRSTFAIFVELGGMAEWSIRHVGGRPAERLYDRYLRLITDAVRDAIREKVLRDDVDVKDHVACLTGVINGVVRMGLVDGARGLAGRGPMIIDLCLRGLGRAP